MEKFKEPFFVDTVVENDEHTTAPPVIAISDARLNANRENAKHSTGAKSPEGKAIVAQNSVTHGLTGKFRVLAAESQSEFDELRAGLLSSHAPADPSETELVTSMAESLWLARRANRLQDRCIEAIESGDTDAAKTARLDLTLYLRYQTTHERSYQRYAAELRKLQGDKKKAEVGFASQKRCEADQQRKQEKHETTNTLANSRLEQQQMKNYLLSRRVKHEKQCQASEERSERWREMDRQREIEKQNQRKK